VVADYWSYYGCHAKPLSIHAASLGTVCGPLLAGIDPLGRYHYAKKLKEGGKPYPDLVDLVLSCHDQYWQTETAIAEGNPVLALESGEQVEFPPVLYIQGTADLQEAKALRDELG
jgi:hypothetical protein